MRVPEKKAKKDRKKKRNNRPSNAVRPRRSVGTVGMYTEDGDRDGYSGLVTALR
jgi:hypothetical protein